MSLFGRPEARYRITATDDSGKAIKSAKAGLTKFGSGLTGMASKFAGLAGIGGFGMLAKSAISFGSALTDSASHIGINVEALQSLQYASTKAGTSNDVLERGLRNIKARIQQAADGNMTYANSIERLGLSTGQLIALPLERKLEALAIAYTNAEDESKAYVDVMNIIGERSGPQLIEVLGTLAKDGYGGVEKAATDAGLVMDEVTAQSLDRASDSIDEFKKKITIFTGGFLGNAMSDDAADRGSVVTDLMKGSHIPGITNLGGALEGIIDLGRDPDGTKNSWTPNQSLSLGSHNAKLELLRIEKLNKQQVEVMKEVLVEMVDFNSWGP